LWVARLAAAMLFTGAKFSHHEYTALMLCLAGVICTALFFVELALSRFQVLPLLFPGMFSVRDRRFFYFNFDISDGPRGKSIRAEAKMIVRMTICLVLSYLWQHCVLETSQQVGTDFPKSECEKGADCFASTLHFVTFFNRQHEAIDCQDNEPFANRVVVSCIRFIPPTATTWLMHLAISHSVTQLNFKAFEVLVWIGGNSKWSRRVIGSLVFLSFSAFVGVYFAGFMTEFVSSWLSFVMSLTIPLFLYTTFRSSKHLQRLWTAEAVQVQTNLEMHLNSAFKDIEHAAKIDVPLALGVTGNVIDGAMMRQPGDPSSGKVRTTLKNMRTAIAGAANTVKRKSFGKTLRNRSQKDDDDPLSPYATESQVSNGAASASSGSCSASDAEVKSSWMPTGLQDTLQEAAAESAQDLEDHMEESTGSPKIRDPDSGGS